MGDGSGEMRILRSTSDETKRLDAAISDALKSLKNCADPRRAAELRLKLYRLRAMRGRMALASWHH
jgi:hypothetical protein